MQNKSVGYIRNQTVQCDYISCSRDCHVDNTVTAQLLKATTIENSQIDDLFAKIKSLEERVDQLELDRDEASKELTAMKTPVVAGEKVNQTLHFDDINLEDPDFDLEAFNEQLKIKLAAEAGVDPDQIVIVDLAQTGSVTARIEIKYEKSADAQENEEIQARKDAFLEKMNDTSAVAETFQELGGVQVEEIEAGVPITSINAKIYQLEQALALASGANVEFQKSILIDDYKLVVEMNHLRILRYDHDIGSYVGGTILLDA